MTKRENFLNRTFLKNIKNQNNINIYPCKRVDDIILINEVPIDCEILTTSTSNPTGAGVVINIDNANVVYLEQANIYNEFANVLEDFKALILEMSLPSTPANGIGMAGVYPVLPSVALVNKITTLQSKILILKGVLP